MNGAFTDQILAEKLSKLNSSQQSIETLSHWCIFHRKRAGQVVTRWEKDLRSVPAGRKVAFLYLANDIIQNSRRKGPEYINEFGKALPSALKDLFQDADDNLKSTISRLISIWEERKVFIFKGKSLRESFLGKNAGMASTGGKSTSAGPSADAPQQTRLSGPLEKIASAYSTVLDSSSEEESALRKCSAAMNDIGALEKNYRLRISAGPTAVTAVAQELQAKQSNLAQLTLQLETCEKNRSNLVTLLKEALETQESKLERVRSQLQAAKAQTEHASRVREELLSQETTAANGEAASEAGRTAEITATPILESAVSTTAEDSKRKLGAAELAAKLSSSSSSAAMLSSVLSKLAAEGNFPAGLANFAASSSSHQEKKLKLEPAVNPSIPYPQNVQLSPPGGQQFPLQANNTFTPQNMAHPIPMIQQSVQPVPSLPGFPFGAGSFQLPPAPVAPPPPRPPGTN